jgi:DNA transposition AAA+ family ATPase
MDGKQSKNQLNQINMENTSFIKTDGNKVIIITNDVGLQASTLEALSKRKTTTKVELVTSEETLIFTIN